MNKRKAAGITTEWILRQGNTLDFSVKLKQDTNVSLCRPER
jgi:hypothetical protein